MQTRVCGQVKVKCPNCNRSQSHQSRCSGLYSLIYLHYDSYTVSYLSLIYISLSFLYLSFSDVLPSHSLHPQGAAEEDPLLHFPSDGAAALSVCVWDVPSPVYEDDLSSANVYPHTHQVSTSAPVCCVVCVICCARACVINGVC